ncbi:MAG: F0F1 ATP synthase subunit delta [Candidatus Wildermuthbacteria bacterium]|nr:F0F1 ATP synthase subunit delta [Candidatus Wildermuthbacteria bacterium]
MNSQKMISVWAKALYLASQGKTDKEKTAALERLSGILEGKKKNYLLPKIIEKTRRISAKKKEIKLFFARQQKAPAIEAIKNKLLKIFGRDKNVVVQLDEGIIGGFRAKTEKFLVRSSVKDFLDELREKTYGEN